MQQRTWNRLRSHLLSELVCLGRHTITSRILTAGGGQNDWSADYRLYAFQRFEPHHLFSVGRHQIEQKLEPEVPFVVAMDDSILRKSGKTIPGASCRRDPLGPPFQVNFVRALRVLQLSAALPDGKGGARMIPIDFQHVPTPKKPHPRADNNAWAQYRQAARQANINLKGVDCIRRLRQDLDEDQQQDRALWMLTDGRFANGTLLKNLPERTQGIARTRADSTLYFCLTLSRKQPGADAFTVNRLPLPSSSAQTIPSPGRSSRLGPREKLTTFASKSCATSAGEPAQRRSCRSSSLPLSVTVCAKTPASFTVDPPICCVPIPPSVQKTSFRPTSGDGISKSTSAMKKPC